MMKRSFKIFIIGFFLCTSFSAKAYTLTIYQILEFIFPISIVELQRINFGEIESPHSDAFVKVSHTGQYGGTVNFLDSSNISPGKYKIYGNNNLTISVKATDLHSYPFLKYTHIVGTYPGSAPFSLLNGAGNLMPPGNGKMLKVGAALKISANTPTGHYKPEFKIEVMYD
jgi:hypothetical protein